MSFNVSISQSAGASLSTAGGGNSYSTISYSGSTEAASYPGIGIRPDGGERRAAKRSTSPAKRVIRRLHGFFIQEEGQEARVAFVENDKLVHYFLPLKLFREGDVTAENQPFEMDEFEAIVEGVEMKGYKVRPSAFPRDSRIEPIALETRSEENLRFVLERAKNAED